MEIRVLAVARLVANRGMFEVDARARITAEERHLRSALAGFVVRQLGDRRSYARGRPVRAWLQGTCATG